MGLEWSEIGEHSETVSPQRQDSREYVVVASPKASELPRLEFNPLTSYAVCSGVGKQLNYRLKGTDLGQACDNDAVRMRRVLHNPLGIPYDNMKLLHSGQQYPATQTNMFDDLQEAAEKVGEDGLLVFTFSGHGIQQADKSTVLVPADGTRSIASALRATHIEAAIQSTKARFTVIILDCCHAGTIAHELTVRDLPSETQRFILAACSSAESAMGHQELGSGFFTFFLSHYLSRHASNGQIPISQALLHCKDACKAMTSLYMSTLREQRKKHQSSASARMTPELTFHDIPWRLVTVPTAPNSTSTGDTVDGIGDQSQPTPVLAFNEDDPFNLDFLKRFLSREALDRGKDLYSICSDSVPVWLVKDALPSLKTLYRLGYLKPSFNESDDVFRTTLCMMAKSLAAVLDRNDGRISSSDVFIVCSIYLSSTVQAAFDEESEEGRKHDEEDGKLLMKLGHVYLCARHYTAGVATALGVDVSLLTELLEMMVEMQSALKGDDGEVTQGQGGDQVDGSGMAKEKKLISFINSVKPNAISHPTLASNPATDI